MKIATICWFILMKNVVGYLRQHECDPNYCTNNGVCVMKAQRKHCQCLSQYYNGVHCALRTDLCQSPIIGRCSVQGTVACIEYFGGMTCECEPNVYTGKFCDQEDIFDGGTFQSEPMIYLTKKNAPDDLSPYLPQLSIAYQVIVAFKEVHDIKLIRLYIAGYLTRHLLKMNTLQLLQVSSASGWPSDLTQKFKLNSSRIFRHSGPKSATILLVTNMNLIERFDFQINPIVSFKKCSPIVRLSGGPCSSVNYITTRLIDKFLYKLKTTTVPMCSLNETTDAVKVEYFKADDDPEGILTNREIFNEKSFIGRTLMGLERFVITVKAVEVGSEPSYDTCWFDNRRLGRFRIQVPTKVVIFVYDKFLLKANISEYESGDEQFTVHWKCTTTWYSPLTPEEGDTIPCGAYFKDSQQPVLSFDSWKHEGQYQVTLEVEPIKSDIQFRHKVSIGIQVVVTIIQFPTIRIVCIHNCGDGNEHSIDVVDRTRPIILVGECVEHCNHTRGFVWDIKDMDRHDVPSYMMLTKNPLIIPPDYLPDEPFFIVTLTTVGNSGEAEYYLCTRKPVVLPLNYLHTTCLYQNYETIFTVLIDRIDLCLNVRDDFFPLYFEFYYKVDIVANQYGVLVAHGASSYIPDVILPGSSFPGSLTIVVATENHVVTEFEQEIEVVSPVSTTHQRFEFVKQLFYGDPRQWHRTSIEYSIQNNELSEVVQKFYLILSELYDLPKVPNQRYTEEILSFQNIVFDRLYYATTDLSFDTAVDLLQFYSVIHMHVLTIDQLIRPMVIRKIGSVIIFLLSRFKEIFERHLIEAPNRYYRVKISLICLLLEGIVALSGSKYQKIEVTENMDYFDRFVEKVTAKELDLEVDDDETFELYLDYSFVDENADFIAQHGESTRTIVECLTSTLDLMGLLPEYENIDLTIYNPEFSIESRKQNLPTGDAFVQMDLRNNWTNRTKPIVMHRIGEVFVKDIIGEDLQMVAVHLLATDGNLFWWYPLTTYTPNFSVLVRFRSQSTKDEPLKFRVHIYYYLPKHIFHIQPHSTRVVQLGILEELTIHTVSITNENFGTLVVEINMPGDNTVRVIGSFYRSATLRDFLRKNVFNKILGSMNNDENKVFYNYRDLKRRRILYIVVVSLEKTRSVPYKISTYDFHCLKWKYTDQNEWNLIPYNPKLNQELYCEIDIIEGSSDDNLFSYTLEPRRVQFYGYVPLSINGNIKHCYVIIKCLFIIFVLFGLLLAIGKLIDINEAKTRKTHYLVDNREHETYLYIVIVKTGSCWNAATTSHVGIKLYGTQGNSKVVSRHVLQCALKSAMPLQRDSVEWFALTTGKSLGNVVAIEIWTDHRGYAPAWYCDKIYLREYKKKIEWIFVVKKWLSLIYDDQKIHRVVYRTQSVEEANRKRFHFDNFYYYHLWFGMFTHKPRGSLTCFAKVLFAFTQLALACYLVLILLNMQAYDDDALGDYGEIRWNAVVLSALIASLLTEFLTYILTFLFEYSELVTSRFLTPPGTIMESHQRVAQISRIIILALCGSMTLFIFTHLAIISVSFGIRKSYMWLYAVILFLLFTVVVFESLIVVVRLYCTNLTLKKKDRLWFRKVGARKDVRRELEDYYAVNKTTVLKKDQTVPVPLYLRQALAKREARFQEFKWLIIEFLLYTPHLSVLFVLFIVHRDLYGYYAVDCIEKMVVDGAYTHTIPMEEITSIDELRQLRTPFKSCHIPSIFVTKYGSYCYEPLTSTNKDRNNYDPGWKPIKVNSDFSAQEKAPFTYASTSTVQNDRIIGRYNIHPSGGYYVFLGRTINNYRFVLNYLKYYEWLNRGTRLIVGEFNAFNPNANMLLVTQVIVAQKAIGHIHTESKIYTLKFTANGDLFTAKEFMVYALFLITTSLICIYQIIVSNSQNDLWSIWKFFDCLMVFLGILLAVLIAARTYYVEELFKRMFMSRNNYFIDFIPAAKAQQLVEIVSGVLILIATFRMWRFLTIHDTFFLVQFTLCKSLPSIWRLTVTMALVIVGFASIFHLLLGPYYEFANTFDRALILVFSMGFGMAPELRIETLDHVGPLAYVLYAFFYIIFRIFFINLFMSVLIANIASARNALETHSSEYGVIEYVFERIFRNELFTEMYRKRIIRKSKKQLL